MTDIEYNAGYKTCKHCGCELSDEDRKVLDWELGWFEYTCPRCGGKQ